MLRRLSEHKQINKPDFYIVSKQLTQVSISQLQYTKTFYNNSLIIYNNST